MLSTFLNNKNVRLLYDSSCRADTQRVHTLTLACGRNRRFAILMTMYFSNLSKCLATGKGIWVLCFGINCRNLETDSKET
jgi:hypothetical protein